MAEKIIKICCQLAKFGQNFLLVAGSNPIPVVYLSPLTVKCHLLQTEEGFCA